MKEHEMKELIAEEASEYGSMEKDKRQLNIRDKAEGTTNIVVGSEQKAVIGFDSRTTYAGFRNETENKCSHITPRVHATMAGNVGECKKTWDVLKKYVSDNNLEGEEPTFVGDLAQIGHDMERSLEDPDCECFIVAVPNEKPEIYYVKDVYNEVTGRRSKAKTEIKKFHAIGSGGTHALTELNRKLKDSCVLNLEEIVELVKFGLLRAALIDCYTGATLWVLIVNSQGIEEKLGSNVIELYLRFYDRFMDIEQRSIFLFYIPEINKKALRKKLGGKESFAQEGHPLTQLQGRYYMHRVIFREEAATTLLLEEAKKVSKSTKPPFTDWPHLKVMNIVGKKVFVARQSMELLKSLRVLVTTDVVDVPNLEAIPTYI